MEQAIIYEIIGYIASVLIAVSLMMTAIVRLRLINLFGAATFSIYGMLIGSIPVAAMNGFIVLINMYYLSQMYRSKEYFKLLQVSPYSKYLRYFVDFYESDIRKFQPGYTYTPEDDDICIFILRDMVPAGLFIGKKTGDGILHAALDFVIPNYRDFKIGSFLYKQDHTLFQKLGITEIRAKAGNQEHARYLKKMGFKEEKNATGQFVLPVD